MNPLKELLDFGQSFWLDYIRRSLITSGELQRMIKQDGLRGITSNPTIFQKAIAGSTDYDVTISETVKSNLHLKAGDLFEKLAIKDIRAAADALRPVYRETKGADGFISFEVSPHLAHDTEGTIAEAHRLWKKIDRPNIMLKVPATKEGVQAVEALIAEGININVTLLFSLSHYEAVANAYIRGLEHAPDPSKVASVASFFLSRIDRVVDKALEEKDGSNALNLRGQIAVASAKIAYKRFKELFGGERWERLAEKGARVQRVLWASTSTKNPAYSDVLYVEGIIGPHTVNTMPPATINAFRDHGKAALTVEEGQGRAENTLKRLAELGVDLNAITQKLQMDGVEAFVSSYDELLATLEEKRQALVHGQKDRRVMKIGQYQAQVDSRLEHWKETNFIRRIWEKDHTLWSPRRVPELTDRLGWLSLPETMHEQLEDFTSLAEEVKHAEIHDIVLLGMGGSSLAPEVFQKVFGKREGYPNLIVLDSTHPAAIKSVENRIDIDHTLFIISSKSGTTIETLSLLRYFWKRAGQTDRNRGRHFIAITDNNTPLMKLAEDRKFRGIFLAPSDVGGRYSALTAFGLLPAALIGMDVHEFLDRSGIMSENCAFCVSSLEAPSLVLAAALGEVVKEGRDKTTFLTSPSIESFPVWLEQLIAESLGKDGKGIVPVVNEPVASPELYGNDRFFIYLRLENDHNVEVDQLANSLVANGHPLIRIDLAEKKDLSQEIFSWEMAVAGVGAVLGLNPFNQPNVQMAKDLAKEMMNKTEKGEKVEDGLETVSAEEEVLGSALENWLDQARERDYVAIQAYLSPKPETTEALQTIRSKLLERLRLATTLGYGPRFLHSTGQLHKGGPNTGLFLQFIDDPEEDLEVPETSYTFAKLIRAQAVGDYQALKQLGRRVLRINLKRDVIRNLYHVAQLIES